MTPNKLQPFYLMNVILYFKNVEDVKTFAFISTNCQETLKAMKINAMIHNEQTEKQKSFYLETMLLLFPNIQTIQFPDVTYIPYQIYTKQLSYIRIFNQFYMAENRDFAEMCLEFDEFSTFDDYSGVLGPVKFIRTSNGTNSTLNYEPGSTPDISTEIITKMEQYEVTSIETSEFLINKYKNFTSLKKLQIIHSTNYDNGLYYHKNYLFGVFKRLKDIKTLQNVHLLSNSSQINEQYLDCIKKLPSINFLCTLYKFDETEIDRYYEIEMLPNSSLLFGTFTFPLIYHNFHLSIDGFEELRKFITLSFHEIMAITSQKLNNICSFLKQTHHSIEKLQINKFIMDTTHNLSTLLISEIFVKFTSVVSLNFIIPKTLKYLELVIDDNCFNFNDLPLIILNNSCLERFKLVGFKYNQIHYINLFHSPNEIMFENCSNIVISSSDARPVNYITINTCENIQFKSPTSLFNNNNNTINVSTIKCVIIVDRNCLNCTITNVITLNLSISTLNINLLKLEQLKNFTFELLPYNNSIQLPILENGINPLTILQTCQLQRLKLMSYEKEITIFLQQSIKSITIIGCKHVHINGLEKCVLSHFDYQNNVDCTFKNIVIGVMIQSYLEKESRGSGIIYSDVGFNLKNRGYYDENLLVDIDMLKNELSHSTIINPFAFQNVNIKSIIIPNSIKCIGNNCFENCKNLMKVQLPTSLKNIGKNCFINCTSLTYIKLPESLKNIKEFCFNNCKSLKEITISSSKIQFGLGAFDKCTSLTSIHYDPNCQSLYTKAIFTDQIQHITLPQYKILPNSTFEKFISLTSIELPTTLVEYADYAFKGCLILKSITVPTSVTKIGRSCFQYCDNLHSIHLHQSLIIDKWCFNMKTALTSIILPTTLTKLHKRYFYGCKSLKLIELPNTLQLIGKSCFNGCQSLQSITIPPLVKTIPALCFNDCYQLSTISFRSIETIQTNAFQNCSSLTTLLLPTSLKTLEKDTFSYLHITSITLPSLITTLPDNCFYCCQFLTTITIPTTITSIGSYCFAYCFSLKTITLPTTITQQGDNIFYNCSLIN